jgi:hypothetical protein
VFARRPSAGPVVFRKSFPFSEDVGAAPVQTGSQMSDQTSRTGAEHGQGGGKGNKTHLLAIRKGLLVEKWDTDENSNLPSLKSNPR